MKHVFLTMFAGIGIAAAQDKVLLYSATGATPGSIASEVERFRNDLGGLNPNQAQNFGGGRREINWDGVGGTRGNDDLPGDFFNATTPRGVLLSTPGARLKVSSDAGQGAFLFEDVTANKSGLDDFAPFSNQKLFAPIGSTVTYVEFRNPGTSTVACTSGFGSIFVDIDRAGGTNMTFFLANGQTLNMPAPTSPVRQKGMSFAGLRVKDTCIMAVKIDTGTIPVDAAADAKGDSVAMDDFIYGEPRELPGR